MQDLNPDDIESVTVLNRRQRHFTARASGAIVIKTKTGEGHRASGKSGLGVSVSSTVAFNDVFIIPDYQNSYGGGPSTSWADTIDGNYIHYALDGSWGPALDQHSDRTPLGQLVRL